MSICKLLRKVSLATKHGVRLLFLTFFIKYLIDVYIAFLEHLHNSIPYDHIGLMIALYKRILFSRERDDFFPTSQYIFECLSPVSFSFLLYTSSMLIYYTNGDLNVLFLLFDPENELLELQKALKCM